MRSPGHGPGPRRGTNLCPGLAGRGQEELRPPRTDCLLSCRSRGGRHVVFYPTLKVRAGLRLRVGAALGEAAASRRASGPVRPGRRSLCLSPCRCGWSWPRSWAWGCPAFSECRCTGWAWTILLIHILSSRERRTIIPGPSGFGDRNHRHHHRCAGGKEFCGLQQCTQCAEPGRVGVHHDCRLLLHQWEILG